MELRRVLFRSTGASASLRNVLRLTFMVNPHRERPSSGSVFDDLVSCRRAEEVSDEGVPLLVAEHVRGPGNEVPTVRERHSQLPLQEDEEPPGFPPHPIHRSLAGGKAREPPIESLGREKPSRAVGTPLQGRAVSSQCPIDGRHHAVDRGEEPSALLPAVELNRWKSTRLNSSH